MLTPEPEPEPKVAAAPTEPFRQDYYFILSECQRIAYLECQNFVEE